MYVAVKGGERAILNSYKLLGAERRGDPSIPELTLTQIAQQMRLAVNRVMTEGSVYDPELAALAIKQAAGDLVEAIFLLRAFRATLPRLGYTEAVDTSAMRLQRVVGRSKNRLICRNVAPIAISIIFPSQATIMGQCSFLMLGRHGFASFLWPYFSGGLG